MIIVLVAFAIVICLVLDRIFKNDVLKVYKSIKYIFVPYGILMWDLKY